MIVNATGVSYSCFNCGFKTGYTEGHPLGIKFRKLLGWLGIDSGEVEVLRFEAMRHSQDGAATIVHKPRVELNERDLPPDSEILADVRDKFPEHAAYIENRKFALDDFPFLVTHDEEHRMNKRVILPFSHANKIVGYTARLITFGRPKYYSQRDPAYVFGLDSIGLPSEQSWIALTEGPFDALCLGGVAVGGAEVREEQADQLEALQRQIIVVPDRNAAGMQMDADHPNSLLNAAIDYGWHVAFPDWEPEAEDVNKAVQRYGRLYVVRTILESTTPNPVAIKLRARKYSIHKSSPEE